MAYVQLGELQDSDLLEAAANITLVLSTYVDLNV